MATVEYLRKQIEDLEAEIRIREEAPDEPQVDVGDIVKVDYPYSAQAMEDAGSAYFCRTKDGGWQQVGGSRRVSRGVSNDDLTWQQVLFPWGSYALGFTVYEFREWRSWP